MRVKLSDMVKAVNPQSSGPERAKGPVDKALDLLGALVRPGGPHRLADIARQTGLTKPTVHRLLQTMAEAGFAAAEGGAYRVGPRLLAMAAAALADSEEIQCVRPVLADLQSRTGQTVLFAVRQGAEALYVEKVESAHGYRMTSRVGGEVPLYCTAVGRAILSALPDGDVAEILGGEPLPARTPRTLTDPAAIREASASASGYFVEDEEYELDVRSIAAPVLDRDGQVFGAIGLSGLTFTLDDASIEVFGPIVRATAGRVSAALAENSPGLGVIKGGRV